MNKSEVNNLRELIKNKRDVFEDLYIISQKDSFNKGNKNLLVSAIDLIVTTSQKMAIYNDLPNNVDFALYDEIVNLSKQELDDIANESYTCGAISIIRYVIAQMFIKREINSAEKLKESIEQLKIDFINKTTNNFIPYLEYSHKEAINFINNYDKGNPFQAWGALYRYLLPFIYDIKLRDSVWKAIEVIRNHLLWSLDIENTWESKNSQGWHNKVRSYFGFEGPSNYGSQRAVLMLHPKNIPDHKNAIQLVCYFTQGIIWAGCDVGVNLSNSSNINIKQYINISEKIYSIDFNNCCGKKLDSNKVIEKFNSVCSRLKENFDFASDTNKILLNKHPELGNEEIAEGNAERSDGNDINLYDPFEENKANSNKQSGPPTKIKNALNTKKKEIYPNIKKTEDYLDRKKIAKYLAEQIIMDKNVEPLNIGIYADWGNGKTQLFNFIKDYLKTTFSFKEKILALFGKETPYYNCEIVDFDAWQYNDQENIWAALIMELMNKCKSRPTFYFSYLLKTIVSYIKDYWQEVTVRILCLYLIFLFLQASNEYLKLNILTGICNFPSRLKLIGLFIITIFPDLFKFRFVNIDKIFIKFFKLPEYNEQLGFRKEIKRLVSFVMDYLSNNHKKRIVLFIDNLDRCSSKHIKQILDSICQFLEMSDTDRSNLIVIFAMDETIIKKALKEENITEDKIYEYMQKIINLPIYPQMPENIGELIDRFFGVDYEIKETLRIEYEKQHYNPRKLSNLRYIDHMVYAVHGIYLKDSNYYADLFKLQVGNSEEWTKLSNLDIDTKLNDKTSETNKYISISQQITKIEYESIENKTVRYLEKMYNYNIMQNIKFKVADKGQSFIFDGIANMPQKDILFEFKYIINQERILEIFYNTIEQIFKYSDSFSTNKSLELVIVLIVGNIKSSEQIILDLNREFQNKLLSTRFSGHVLLINKDELTNY